MEDLTGKTFNNLTVIKYIYKYRRSSVWECRCICGNITNVIGSKLKSGSTKSCGCYKAKNLKSKFGPDHRGWKGYNSISASFFGRIRSMAALRNIEFNVSVEYLWELFIKQDKKCAYTGIGLEMPINVRQLRGKNNELIASLDRIDSEKGYIKDNLQWVCKRVNYMKHTMQNEYFLNWIKLIYENRFR